MSQRTNPQIDVEAATALLHWKSLFVEEVTARARRLAADSDPQGCVTLQHYREAARGAVHALSVAIFEEGIADGDQKAA